MRRIAVTALAVAVLVGLVVVAAAGGNGSGGTYQVRAYFDNGGFIVNGEDVRVAGANVGSVSSVDVSMPDEIDSCQGAKTDVDQCNGGRGAAVPGKAVVVLDITDPGFKDFRADATCLIRPQSLIGEKFVDCLPTRQRAPGTPAPPELKQIPDGQRGAGQYMLPFENNGKAVDLDLVNNIQRAPYAERFRLIINDLGAALAARGEDLDRIILRSDPALRETNKVLAIIAAQNKQLAKLAEDSDATLEPLARERAHLVGFLRNSATVNSATAERGADLERNIELLPQTLREVRSTMVDLGGFSDAARPVFSELLGAAPAITRLTRATPAFAEASTISLTSLGDAAEASGDNIRDADPVVVQVRNTAHASANPTFNLKVLLSSLKRSGAFPALMEFLVNSTTVLNGFDQFGHYQRTNILVSTCIFYQQPDPFPGCGANFTGPARSGRLSGYPSSRQAMLRTLREATSDSGGTLAIPDPDETGDATGLLPALPTAPASPTAPAGPDDPSGAGDTTGTGGDQEPDGVSDAAPRSSGSASDRGGTALLDYLLGP
jgi:ABC-type transporter Mla subunit MlaD